MQLHRNTFKKGEKLKSKKLIEELFKKGKVIHHYPFKVLYSVSKSSDLDFPAKLAVSVSKRNFKNAVDRNHIKRKIREAYRISKHKLYDHLSKSDQNLYFFVIYTTDKDLDFKEIEDSVKRLLSKLISKLS